MRICAIVKYPPIQGGVSAQSYWSCRALAQAGHEVHVVTNADEVEDDYRIVLTPDDEPWLQPSFGRGRVQLHPTEPMSVAFVHVPQSNPFTGKLAGRAAEVVREHGCEAILSYYYEPYGVAAHLCSSWTGVPYVVRNAGSDVGRLMNCAGLGTTYREILRSADGVCSNSPDPLLGLGVRPEQIYRCPPPVLAREQFSPSVQPLDLNAHLVDVVRQAPTPVSNARPLDPALPVIGIYGKMGASKGSYDLLAALGTLRAQGLRFNLVALTRGRWMTRYLEAIEQHGLADVTWVLPFVAHWKVGRFIRACTAVCFLERDFQVTFHTPSVPREVLASGTCLVVSGEVAAKQLFRDRIRPGDNAFVVPDPRVHSELAATLRRVIEDPAAAAAIGRRGEALIDDANEPDVGVLYERLLCDVIARRKGQPSEFSAEDRVLPATRADGLRRLVPRLVDALEERADEAIRAFVAAHANEPDSAFDDAAAFCRWTAATLGEADATLGDVARYSGMLVWMGHITAGDEASPPFPRPDLGMATLERAGGEVLLGLAPLRSRWARVERFHALPTALAGDTPAGAEVTYVFHKQPNANGHHFRVNAWTAELLARCDGERSGEALIEMYRSRSERPAEEVRTAVVQALRRLHRAGIIGWVVARN